MIYDLIVIGAGWAGFNAAVYASKLGKSVCLVEENEVGGTCLNKGCIPAKVFVAESKKGSSLPDIQKRKTEVISRLRQGLLYVLKTNNITLIKGRAALVSQGKVSVGGTGEISAKRVLIATGSYPKDLPQLRFDHNRIVSSDDVLEWQVLPGSILIVGGGFIGCEFASIFRRMGVEVTIVEARERLLPTMDRELGTKLLQVFQKQGIQVKLGSGSLDGVRQEDFEKIFVAVGRGCRFDSSAGAALKLKTEKDALWTDRTLATGVKNVFAAGDVVGGYMLAHVAAYEGELAVRNMFKGRETRDYSVVPSSVFTVPEAASVGLSEEEAVAFGADCEAKTISYLAIGMAHVLGETQGFLKVIVDKKKKIILGSVIFGKDASEMVNLFSVIIKNKVRIDELQRTIFAHPSLSEIAGEIAKAIK